MPETVPTIAVPWPELPTSLYAITTLLLPIEAKSKPSPDVLNSASEPKEIPVPETVPTMAFPLSESPSSL